MHRLSVTPILLLFLLLFPGTPLRAQQGWLTHFEQSGFVATPDYARSMEWLRRLDSASAWISLQSFGSTPQGRALPLLVLSKDGAFTPEAARASGKDIVLIQAGIHAGEIDGKDAGMMLLREIAITRTKAALADHAIILFIPIFNVDGHERRSPYSRINQNGPEVTGWRVTANNLNLNRDYMKADAPEMRAWLRMFHAWKPDMLIDCHVTDGIDFQYNLSYAMEMYGNMHPAVAAWHRTLQYWFLDAMEKQGDPVFPYVFPREQSDIAKGVIDWASSPRLSTGYAAVCNRANLLIETHMLKPYKDRVIATYRMIEAVLSYVRAHPGTLRRAVRDAEEDDIRRFSSGDTTAFPLRFQAGDRAGSIRFKGYATELRRSVISGGSYTWWDHSKPQTVDIPLFNDVRTTVAVRPSRYYLIPQEWTDIADILSLHDVRLHRLAEETRLPVQRVRFSNPVWRNRPYEGRLPLTVQSQLVDDTVSWPAGTIVVDMAQSQGRVALNLLEADAPDSFVFWGFFNAIFEQKEYYEEYMMEALAPDMLRNDAALRNEFEKRVATDSAFAASPRARLDFLYQRSPWYDSSINLYPIARCMALPASLLLSEEQWKRDEAGAPRSE